MTKINNNSYIYIIAIFFAIAVCIYINIIDESDEKIFKNALASGKKEIFVGKLKSINLVSGLKDELVFYKEDGSEKKFLVNQINTTNGLKVKNIKAEEWYEVVKIVDADKIIDMHQAVQNQHVDEIRALTHSDKQHIQHYIDDEFKIDLILSSICVALILFSGYKIYKYQSQT